MSSKETKKQDEKTVAERKKTEHVEAKKKVEVEKPKEPVIAKPVPCSAPQMARFDTDSMPLASRSSTTSKKLEVCRKRKSSRERSSVVAGGAATTSYSVQEEDLEDPCIVQGDGKQ